jgi:hypothetical protein
MENKPELQIEGQDGNIFAVLGAASNVLRKAGVKKEKIEDMRERVFNSESYNEALAIIGEYVEYV